MDELKSAIEWVNTHRTESANLSFDMTRQAPESIELFLERVNFDFVSGDALVNKVEKYFKILVDNNIINLEIDDKLLEMFRL